MRYSINGKRRNKRIVLVHLMDPLRPAKGGAIRYTLNILKHLLSREYRVIFIGTQSPRKIHINLKMTEFFKKGYLKILYISSTGNLLKYILKLFTIPQRELKGYDIIHTQRTWFTIPFILRGVTRSKKIITTVHAPPLETLRSSRPLLAALLYPIYMFIEYLSFTYSHAIIFASKSLMDYYRLTKSMKNKSIVIPGGTVDMSVFKPPSDQERTFLRTKLGIRDDDIVLVFVGRLEKVKRVHLLIESLRIMVEKGLHNIKAIIVGDGPERERLKKMVEKYNLENNIIFTGSVPPEKVVEYYKVSDILCLPSLAEASPNVIKEALAVGIPFIATNVSSEIRELASLGVGVVVPKHVTAEQLANTIIIFSNYVKKRRYLLRNKCRRIAEIYDVNRVMKYIEKLYDHIGSQ